MTGRTTSPSARATGSIHRRAQLGACLLIVSIAVCGAFAGVACAAPAGAGLAAAKPLLAAPKVTKQPSSVAVEEGRAASFESTASGSPTVQWQMSTDGGATWNPIAGATADVYTIASVDAAENNDELRAVFVNAGGETTSRAAVLTVERAPLVTQQPLDDTADEGQAASFEASADGSPSPTVQWQSLIPGGTWKNVSGATSDVLEIGSVKTAESGTQFRAVFKNALGEAISEAAKLSVQTPPKVTKQPTSETVTEGTAASFEATASAYPAASVIWEVSTNAGSSWSAIPESHYTQLIITGAQGSYSGYEYRATFANAAGSVTSSPATLTVQARALVTEQPTEATVLVGATATFHAAATGTPTPTVQWETSSDGGTSWAPVSGADAGTLTIADAQLSQSATRYRAVFTNNVGTTYTNAVTLTVSSTDYDAYGWGMNTHGQVGIGSGESAILSPAPIKALSFVTALSGGARHSLALLANGTVYSWGYNGHGQLGDEGALAVRSPIAVEHLSGVSAIAAGGNHSLALLRNGTVEAWGDDEDGQLGNGRTADSEVPVPVQGSSRVIAIAAGEEHSLALLENGTVEAWGGNERGQLGDGGTRNSDTPVLVKGLSGVKAIAAGGQFSLALLENGTVEAWGDDSHDQLGNAGVFAEQESEKVEEEGFDSELPIPVEGLSAVSSIAAGKTHSLALLDDGSVMAWGADSEGELGNGVAEPALDTPTAVQGLPRVTAIAAGDETSLALLSSGNLTSWGSNRAGSLGDGLDGEYSDVPVSVLGIGQVSGISAGASHMLVYGQALPSISSVSPSSGPTRGGNTVTISGVNLAGASAVRFGSTAATSFTVESATSISAVVPAGAGTVDVTVTTPSGASPTSSADRYGYRLAATVTKLSVKTGSASGGSTVVLTGTEFAGASAVYFGSAAATQFTVTSATTITAVSPPNVSGVLNVTVAGVGGVSAASSKNRFKSAPVIDAIEPGAGPEAGGTSVTISGAGFALGDATRFKFGKATAKSVDCTSTTSCAVLAPSAKAIGAVAVIATAAKVKSSTAPGATFTYE